MKIPLAVQKTNFTFTADDLFVCNFFSSKPLLKISRSGFLLHPFSLKIIDLRRKLLYIYR